MSEREYVDYAGERFWLQSSGRYFQSGDKTAEERLLHRRIYTDHKGPIPPGFDVHHKNDDWRDNDPDNLEAILQSDHRRHHMAARWASEEDRGVLAAGLERAREAAKAWHGSPEGLAWHRANGVAAWEDREPIPRKCDHCGTDYLAWFKTRGRFCSKKCMADVANRRVYDRPSTCEVCGVGFMASRYKVARTCSRTCAGVIRRGVNTRTGLPTGA